MQEKIPLDRWRFRSRTCSFADSDTLEDAFGFLKRTLAMLFFFFSSSSYRILSYLYCHLFFSFLVFVWSFLLFCFSRYILMFCWRVFVILDPRTDILKGSEVSNRRTDAAILFFLSMRAFVGSDPLVFFGYFGLIFIIDSGADTLDALLLFCLRVFLVYANNDESINNINDKIWW